MSTVTRNPWDKFPEKELQHLNGNPEAMQKMQIRRRHRHVRYWCFRMQTLVTTDRDLEGPENQPGFVEFWLDQKPLYAISPKREKISVPADKDISVMSLGGYEQFARIWDIDENLDVYIRHSSVWHEWNLTLMRVAPYLGDV